MPISFECQTCNKKYKVDEKLAGKRATCKGCGSAMQIPGGAPARAPVAPVPPPARVAARVAPAAVAPEPGDADLDFDALLAREQSGTGAPASASSPSARKDAGGYCPDCGANMLKGTRVCVQCGYDIRVGKQIKTQVEEAPVERTIERGARRGGGGYSFGRLAFSFTLLGLTANLLPITGYQLKILWELGSSAPIVGCVFGLVGAALYFMSANPGAGVLSGGGVIAAFAICMSVDPYAKYRAREAASAPQSQLEVARNHFDESMQRSQAEAEARREAARQESKRRIDEMRAADEQRRQEFLARNSQMSGGSTGTSLVPTYIPPPPPRQLPSDPVDRDLFLLQSGSRSERITAAAHLLSAPPKERLAEVAGVFRGLVSEQDISLRRQSIPGMLLVGADENVPALITLLGDTNAEVRLAAIKVLARLKDERALEPLLNRLGVDTDETIEAVRPFADHIEPLLISKLRDADSAAKVAAAKGLLVFGTPASLPELRTAAKDADPTVATAARATWKKIAPGELDPFNETLLDLANDASVDAALARLAAMQPDEKRREAVVAAVTPLLQAGSRQIDLSRVAGALVNWQGKEAVPALLPLLTSGDADRKQKLARALAKTGDPQVATVLVEWVTANTDRALGVSLLGEMGSAAEDAVLGMLFVDDAQLAPITLALLEKVGTSKSLRQIRMFSAKVQNPALARQAEGVANTIEKRRQVELREQRLRATTAPTTKKP